jgi:hypothetical protein
MVDLFPEDTDDFQFNELETRVTWLALPVNFKNSDGTLWKKDLERCRLQGEQAIFRTMLLSMINRGHLFYGYRDIAPQAPLEFAVETPWTCPPMPTHAERRREKFLTTPKPDLAVGFRRQSLFQNCDWNSFPEETQKLICYEGDCPPNYNRAFYFLTIETTHWSIGIDDPVAINRSLNNASQALHNMYEFFKEADREIGEQTNVKSNKFTSKFFDRVRFFSVVAVAGSMEIRIHRACQLGERGRTGPKNEYPLKFVNSSYEVFHGTDFTHKNVMEKLNKIFLHYGVNELHGLLKDATEEMDKKFVKYSHRHGYVLSRGPLFYSYHDVEWKGRRKSSPRLAQTPTRGSQTPVTGNDTEQSYRLKPSFLSMVHSVSGSYSDLNAASGTLSDSNELSNALVQEQGTAEDSDAVAYNNPKKKRKK